MVKSSDGKVESSPQVTSSLWSDTDRKGRQLRWVGCLSFEDRCIGSLAQCETLGLRLEEVIVLEYDTRVVSQGEERKRSEKNRRFLEECAARICKTPARFEEVSPYAFGDIESTLRNIIRASSRDATIFDITCMTKIHTIALAATLASTVGMDQWAIAYTSPESYGDLENSEEQFGWRDVIIAPVGTIGSLKNEPQSRGIVITGHESDRLLMGLGEIEPSGGLILIADTKGNPDMRILCERKNKRVIGHLLQLGAGDWRRQRVGLDDAQGLFRNLRGEITRAEKAHAPIILFPFGPKAMVFLASLQLAASYGGASWFVYPVPEAYDVNYTTGVGSTRWLATT